MPPNGLYAIALLLVILAIIVVVFVAGD